ncbi:MAG: 2-dehydropantoate 2-reductase N-terminal domain-containing protein [Chloroflexota bacterium]
MTDLVVGGGAVGTLIAWALATGGRDVAIVRRGKEAGLNPTEVSVVDPARERHTARVTEVVGPDDLPAAPELIVFAVKMFDLAAAAATCAAWPSATSLTVSNGVGAEEIVAGIRPDAGLIAGSVTASVERSEDGSIARRNRGGIALAPVRGDVERPIENLLAAFSVAGLKNGRIDDADAMKWSKLLANLVGNATSAIVDRSPAELYADPGVFALERRQLLEALAVMRRLGLSPRALPGADVRLLAAGIRLPAMLARPILKRIVGGARGGKDPSLRVHAMSGSGPSEVDWLNGAVADVAERLGRVAPVNRRLTTLLHEVLADPARREWFNGRLDRLVEAAQARA